MYAIIQAGGRSARMGEDKSWLLIAGQPMIEHVLTAAQNVAERCALVIHPGNPHSSRYEELAARWNAKLLVDLHDYRGPLGGIETALRQCDENEDALILACDLPFLTREFLTLLREIHETEKNELTVPFDLQGRPQMLAAVYAASCLGAVAAMLSANELKARCLQERVTTRIVSFAEYAHLPNAEQYLLNINTPKTWEQYRER